MLTEPPEVVLVHVQVAQENHVILVPCLLNGHESVGHLMKETEDCPARYFVEEFPTSEQLAKIGKVEV